MKNGYQSIAALFLFVVMAAASNAEDVPKTSSMPMKDMEMGGMGMGMHHGMGGMTEAQKDQHLRSMQEHMLKMHDLSNQILGEKDASKKEQLKTEQLQLMKAHHAQMKEHRQKMKHSSKK
jgi:hypothetical protein